MENNATSIDMTHWLPLELSQKVMSYLTAKELARVSSVGHKWRNAANCNALWKVHCVKEQWTELNMVGDRFRSHYPLSLQQPKQICDNLTPLCDWRLNYERHRSLPVNWEYNRSIRYKLTSMRDSPVSCIACDGVHLAIGSNDGTVTIINVSTLPYFVTEFRGLLNQKILSVQIRDNMCVIQQHMLLQIFSLQQGFQDAKAFDQGFSLIEYLERTKLPANSVQDHYRAGKLKDVFFRVMNDRVYVTVRDFQCVYVWDIRGKRVDTIHINNRMCKMRDMAMNDEGLYVIYAASRSIRHVTAYSFMDSKWIFEVTTPLCKTQKLKIAGGLLAGVAIAGPAYTCKGVITVWDRWTGKIISERHTEECVNYGTFEAAYEVIVYCQTTSIVLWEPRSNWILRKVSTLGNPLYLKSLPFTFLAVYTDHYAYVWDWFMGTRCFRLLSKYESESGEILWADSRTLILKTEEDMVEMIGFI